MKNKPLAFLLISVLLLICSISVSAQNKAVAAPKDYASYPYWIDMMQDPHGNFFEIQKAFYSYWEGRETHRGDGYKPFKRWEYYWQFRINPDGTFPEPGQVYREYNNYVKSHPAGAGLKTGQAAWQELGPKSRVDYGGYVGVGRVNAIGFHPTDTATVYIGAPKGGFWITNDGGRTWTSPTDHLPTMGVSAILVDPTNPNLILIGTGDRDGGDSQGMGVFRSDDGGMTWQQFNTGMGNVTVGMFARPESNQRLILAAANGGIFKTLDGGENWVITSPDNSNYRDVKFRPGSETIAYATSNNGFYRSINGGDTWSLVPTSSGYIGGGRLVIGVTPAKDSLVYLVGGAGEYQGCFLSRNFGETFSTQSTSPNILGWEYNGSDVGSQAWYDLMIHIDVNNPLIVYVGGINIWKSVDGGKKWQIRTHWWGDRTNEVHADQHTFAFNPANNRLYAGNDGGVYYTANQGTTWKEISEGLGIGQLYKIGVSNADPKKITGGFQDNGSATWIGTNWVNSGGGDGMECAVDPYDGRYSYTTVYYGPINRYFNNSSGRNIAGKGTNGITEDGSWVTPFLISEVDGNTMVIGYKNIWISRNVKSDGAITWTKISNNLAGRNDVNMAVLEQSPADANILFAAREDGKLFRTDNLLNPPVVWTDITSQLPVNGNPSDFECHPYNATTVYMVLNKKVYKSTNKGSSWQDISGSLPAINITTIALDKTSNEGLYVGTDAGTFYKDADMADWVMFGESFPVSVGVSELEIYNDPRNRAESRLRASTFGRGVWEINLAESDAVLPPSLLSATILDKDVELNWVPPFYEQNILGYRIYRNGELIRLVNGLSFTDEGLEPDVTFTYKVSALYNGGIESVFTNEATATINSPIELPYFQAFEKSTGGFAGKYSIEGWRYGTTETLGVTGRAGHFFAASSVAAGEGVQVKDYLVTPAIDLGSYTGKTITLRFAYTMRLYRTYDKFSAVYRTSPDSAWVKLVDLKPPSKYDWVWDTTQVNLPAKALTAKAQIGFFYDNSNQFAWGAAVDDVELFLNTTSVDNIDNQISIKVFPNPNHGRFSIELASGEAGGFKLQIVNITGQVILEKNYEINSGTLVELIDLSAQPKGVYQLTVRSEKGEWKQKLTIQ
ncbi:MAG: T9SS type A sorting domain-containing protein [Bacteroidia bacterium]|nr:T9SS type A sorting domain-containing protein [Bacteroidia bacterium]